MCVCVHGRLCDFLVQALWTFSAVLVPSLYLNTSPFLLQWSVAYAMLAPGPSLAIAPLPLSAEPHVLRLFRLFLFVAQLLLSPFYCAHSLQS